MVFSSLSFLLLFLPVLYLLLFLAPSPRWRNGVLVAMSLLFYAWGEPVWVLAMLLSTAVNFVCAGWIAEAKRDRERKAFLVVGVIASVCFLFYFKYSAFVINSFAALFGLSLRVEAPRLPIGISFYTFQILTYTVDVYRGKAPRQKNFFRLLLYISCFPQLIAGPIVQYADVADQLSERRVTPDGFTLGLRRFIVGLAKKVLLANICGAALEELPLGGMDTAMSFTGAWLAAFLYTLQIYFDFSAYSDMAIGLGKTLGFTYKENFNYPYVSVSVTEFWRRWHISLGSFFRDYVYIPLGGNRRGSARTALNLCIVWALTGLWHGASWNFVLWGLYYALLLLLERFALKSVLERTPRALRRAGTFLFVMLGWVIFYYTDFAALREHLLALLALSPAGGRLPWIDGQTLQVLKKYTVYPLLAFGLTLPVLPTLKNAWRGSKRLRLGAENLACVLLLAASLIFLIGQSYNPFIYFRF